MAEECYLCNKKIEETFLSKFKGVIVKININKKNKIFHVCDECQKKFRDSLKEEVEKRQNHKTPKGF